MIRADNLANNIADKEYRAFWKHLHKQQKGKVVNHAAVVGGYAGEKEIAEMWVTTLSSCTTPFKTSSRKIVFTSVLITVMVVSLPSLCMIYWFVLANKIKGNQ